MNVKNLRCNGKIRPVQVDPAKISFSFQLSGCENGEEQSGYEIQLWKDGNPVWDSGKIDSSECLYIRYEGPGLKPDSRYEWRARVWNQKGERSDFSSFTWFETGLGKKDWKAEWIGYDRPVGEGFRPELPFYCADDFKLGENTYYLPPVPYIRKSFTVDENKPVVSAKLYYTALGLVDIQMNGRRIRQGLLSPGISDYRKTVYTRAVHVEDRLCPGENGIGILLADGWYAGYMGLNNREWYGSCPRVCAQLHITYADGSREILKTDGTWKAAYGALLEADLYQGETWDARLAWDGWSEAGFDDSAWEKVRTGSECEPEKTPHPGPPIMEHSHIIPEIIRKKDDKILLYFPVYVCGVCAFTVRGPEGSSFSVRHAEMLGPDGELYLDGNRSARCRDAYTLRGAETEYFRPRFTWHGFRYAEVTCSGPVEFLSVEGIQTGTALSEPTRFTCSSPVANTVFRMIRATEKANLMDTPTDCCARDERLGWGLEGNHFMYAMTYMNDQRDAIRKWNRDIWDGQRENGATEAIAPAVIMKDVEPFIGDLQSYHGLYMVHALYRMYGDTDSVRTYLKPLKHFFDFLEYNSDRYLRYATSCDWLGILEATDHSDTKHGYGECSALMLGTSHYAVAAAMMEKLCEAVNDSEAEKYRRLYRNIRTAFRQNFMERDGLLRRGKQGDYIMALFAGLIPERFLPKVLSHVQEELMKSGYIRWFGGTPTTPYLLPTLKKYGMTGLANAFVTAATYPSIGYMNRKGFDTVWERWDAIHEDGSIHPQVMNAMCHEGLAAVAGYFISGIAGIEAEEAGFRRIRLEPGVSREITAASASFHSPYGEIRTRWEWKEGMFTLKCGIPAGTTAKIILPGIKKPEFIKGAPQEAFQEKGKSQFHIRSGVYELRTAWEELQDYQARMDERI